MNELDKYKAWKEANNRNSDDTELNAYSSFSADLKDIQANAATQEVQRGLLFDPDIYAQDMHLSAEMKGELGIQLTFPPALIGENRKVWSEQLELQKIRRALKDAPITAKWLQEPNNAIIARDNLEDLSWFERTVRSTGRALERGGMRIKQVGQQYIAEDALGRSQDLTRSFGDILGTEMRDQGILPGPDDLASAGWRYLASRITSIAGHDDRVAASDWFRSVGETAKMISETKMSPGAERFKKRLFRNDGDDLVETLNNFGRAVQVDTVGAAAFIFQVGAEMAPQLAAATGVTAATRNPSVGAMFMGGTSAATERYVSPAEFFTENGLDISKPEDVEKLIADPELLKAATDRGVIRGAIIGSLDAISGGIASKAVANNPAINLVAQGILQSILGGGGEYAAQVASGDEVDFNEVLVEALAEFATAPLEVAGVGGRSILRNRAKARGAQSRKVFFDELSGKAVTSKLRERMPEKMKEFLARASENGPIENIYIPAEKFQEYFQSNGNDPRELIEAIDGITQQEFEDALALGGDIVIPTAEYAANLAGTDHDAFFSENMRFDPDEMTWSEAQDFNSKVNDVQDEMFEMAEALREEEEGMRQAETRIHEAMISQLRAAGRAPDVAAQEAMLWPAFYRAMANRSGMSTEELLEMFPLPDVRGSLPEGLQPKNVDEFTRTMASLRGRKQQEGVRVLRGASLMDFIAERGVKGDRGEVADLLDNKGSHRPGQRKILREDGQGLDVLASEAVEAGYLYDVPEAQAYLEAMRNGDQVPDLTPILIEAMRREIGGDLQFTENPQADLLEAQSSQLDEIEQYLFEIGADPDVMSDDEIKALLEGQQKGVRYGQFAGQRSETADLYALAGAKKQIEAGRKAEIVRRETGWSRGADGEWRYEISDADAKLDTALMPEVGPDVVNLLDDVVPLGDLLDHERLYAAYPDLKLAEVIFDSSLQARGMVDAAGATVSMNPSAFSDEAGFLSTLLHEVQHLIQDRESFARGGNLGMSENVKEALQYLAAHKQRQADHSESRIRPLLKDAAEAGDMLRYANMYEDFKRLIDYHHHPRPSSVLRHIRTSTGWFHTPTIQQNETLRRTALELDRSLWNLPKRHKTKERNKFLSQFAFDLAQLLRSAVPPEIWQFLKQDPRQTKSMIKALDKAYFAATKRLEPHEKLKRVAKDTRSLAEKSKYLTPFEVYQRLSGEVEARNTQARAGMSDEELRNTPPSQTSDIQDREEILISGSGTVDVPFLANMEEGQTLFQSGSELFKEGQRGSIQLPAGGIGQGETIINLFENADLSTMLHESGHYFLGMYQALINNGSAPAALVSDYDAVKKWWLSNAEDVAKDATIAGAEVTAKDVLKFISDGTTGNQAKDNAIDVGQQEQWARAFETYLMEGKAPSQELRGAFERFRAWLVSIYRRVLALDVNISDDLRGVFDRMLATDEEIQKAQAEIGPANILEQAEALGVPEEILQRLHKLNQEAQDQAKAKALREIMRPIQRETEKKYRDEKANVREEVERTINASPVYRAFEWLGNRRWLGDGAPQNMPEALRLDRRTLVERYGEGVLKTLPRGRYALHAVKGLDPDEVAGWFGFQSGDQMVRALENAPKRSKAIDAETERVMLERHGDPLRDGRIQEVALSSLHNDKQAQFLAAELKAIKELVGDTSSDITWQQTREMAKATVARTKVRDAIKSARYLNAERQASRELQDLAFTFGQRKLKATDKRRDVTTTLNRAAKADDGQGIDKANKKIDTANASTDRSNDIAARMIAAARRRLMNHALYSASQKAADEVTKVEKLVTKLKEKTTRNKLAGDYLEAIDDVLETYDFRRLSGRQESKRGALNGYVAKMVEAGRESELAIPEHMLRDMKRTPYKTLSMDHLRGVYDTLKNIEHMARMKKKLIDARNKRDLDEVVSQIEAAFSANVKSKAPGRVDSDSERRRRGIREYLDIVLNADTLLREVDGFKDMGAAYSHIKQPIDQASDELQVMRKEAAQKFDELYAVYTRKERNQMSVRLHIPEINDSLSKWDMISVALNTGNEQNIQRLTDNKVKGAYTSEQVGAITQHLDKRDWDFVQSVWDYVNTYWPKIEAREKRITGVTPKKVATKEVQTQFGTYRGGYYPLKYDPRLSPMVADETTQDLMKDMQAGRFGKAATRNGHTKERAKSSGRPVMIDIGVLHGHINQVVYDLALSEAVNSSWKILQDPRVKERFYDTGKLADHQALEMWLQDVASGEVRSAAIIQKTARSLKSGFTISKLAFNLSTVLVQVTGIAQSMVVIGKKDFMRGLQAYVASGWDGSRPKAAVDVMAKSAFMQERETTFSKDIYDIIGEVKTGPTAGPVKHFTQAYLAPLGFWLMQKTQFYVVDMPTWLGAYKKGLRQFKADEAKAVAYADRMVARAQASGNFADRSAVERGTISRDSRQNDVVRLFTALGSYMFAKANVAYERTGKTDFTSPAEVLSWAMDMTLLFTLEAVLYGAIKGTLPGMGDDDEEEGGWGEFLVKQTALSIVSTIPFVRDLAGPMQGYGGGGAYGSIGETLTKPFYQAAQGEVDKALVKSWVDMGGMLLHLPSTQTNRVVDAAWRQSEGDGVAPIEYVMGKR